MKHIDERQRLIDEIADDFRCTIREIHRGMPQAWLDTEITMPQFKTLMVLFGMGQATMGELAEALGTGVSTVTGIIDRLVDHGLVAREEDRHDRRVVVGRPTAKGLDLIDRLMVASRELTTRALSRLSTEDLLRVAEAGRVLRQVTAPREPTNTPSGR